MLSKSIGDGGTLGCAEDYRPRAPVVKEAGICWSHEEGRLHEGIVSRLDSVLTDSPDLYVAKMCASRAD